MSVPHRPPSFSRASPRLVQGRLFLALASSLARRERVGGRKGLHDPSYLNPKDGKWKDAMSLRPVDLATLEMAFAHARMFIEATPLPGQPVEGDEYEELHQNGDVEEDGAS